MKDFEVKFREKKKGAITMCTILDAAEERGVNRGETLKLIMMVQKKIKKGDSIAKIADDLVEDEIVISPIYKMVKESEDTERDIYQRVTCSHPLKSLILKWGLLDQWLY